MKALYSINKKLTIIFIAHRLSTIKECDCIYEFDKGKIKAQGTFEELKTKSKSFQEMISLNEIKD